MALSSLHPSYTEHAEDWIQLRDFAKGERAVKAKGETYLPPTQGMRIDGYGKAKGTPNNPNLGQAAYDAYLLRAVFPEYMGDALQIFMGMLHNKSPVIELPPEMEPLRDSATPLGEPLELLLQRINLEQLTTGRLGLLADLPEEVDPANPLPFIALYVAEAIRNWDDNEVDKTNMALKMVILDESSVARQMGDFDWTVVTKYRLLQMNDAGEYEFGAYSNADGGTLDYDESQMSVAALRGQTLDKIPFVFVNAQDISPEPGEAPLISLARMCGAIYRGEADYRQNLFLQGQDTLVIVGERRQPALEPGAVEEPLRTGAGSRIDLDVGGSAEYVGVTATGLSEQRTALENDRKRAESRSGQLIDASRGDKESGTALTTRVGAQTATLNQIATIGGLALEIILKRIAVWMKLDPKLVKVQPNFEFADYQMAGQDLMNLMTAKSQGAPISQESIHRLMVQGNLTRFDFQTEQEKIAQDPPPPIDPLTQAKIDATKNPPAGGGPGGTGNGGPGAPAPKDPSNPAPK